MLRVCGLRRLCLCALLLAGCAKGGSRNLNPSADLTFLTRDGCPATSSMRGSLDAALKSMGLPTTYRVIDVETLPETDARRGYGTPTVLLGDVDLFGMPTPAVPLPPAT